MKRLLTMVPLTTLMVAQDALAAIGQGSARIPFTDWLIELYNVTNNVYVPLLLVLGLAVCMWMIKSGHRITENIGRLAILVVLGAGGLTLIAQAAGANMNVALLW